jgi:hypothetical protein
MSSFLAGKIGAYEHLIGAEKELKGGKAQQRRDRFSGERSPGKGSGRSVPQRFGLPKRDAGGNGHTGSQSGYINKRIQLASEQLPAGDLEIAFKHNRISGKICQQLKVRNTNIYNVIFIQIVRF